MDDAPQGIALASMIGGLFFSRTAKFAREGQIFK